LSSLPLVDLQRFFSFFFCYSFGENSGNAVDIGNFGRNGEDRVYIDRHGQLISVAVIDVSANGRDFNAALLLARCALGKIAVVNYLKPDQPGTNSKEPKTKEGSQAIQPGIGAGLGYACGFQRKCDVRATGC